MATNGFGIDPPVKKCKRKAAVWMVFGGGATGVQAATAVSAMLPRARAAGRARSRRPSVESGRGKSVLSEYKPAR